jgi:hypothetical protein
MNMRDNLRDFYKVLTNDETLLRLLHYKPSSPLDDPTSPTKPDILGLPTLDKWNIINSLIYATPKTDDLNTQAVCRLFFYPGRRSSTSNYLFSTQEVIFDVLVHFDFENVDQRMSWIADRVNDLVCDQRITGFGKVEFKSGSGINAPTGYVGYRLVYAIGSDN